VVAWLWHEQAVPARPWLGAYALKHRVRARAAKTMGHVVGSSLSWLVVAASLGEQLSLESVCQKSPRKTKSLDLQAAMNLY